jgi:hypothetical protein
MKVTLELPDECREFLPRSESEITEVVSAGLRSRRGRITHEIQELDDVMELLAGLPSPDEVLSLHPSPALAERTTALLQKHRAQGLSNVERGDLDQILRVEHLVRVAKARAFAKSTPTGAPV